MIVSIWVLFFQVHYQTLFTSLRPADAAAIVADLDRKKISYRLADGGATILVPADVVDRTRLSVMTEDIPLKGTVGFELFDRSDMGLTDFAQKINYQRALQGELERTISTLDGVDSARVHLSLGEDRIFRDDQVPPKASVTIRMRKGLTLPTGAAQGIQRLIAAAVPSLEAANVVILDEQGRLEGMPSPAPRSGLAAISPVDEERHAVEQYYRARARMALERVYPLAGLSVVVEASALNVSTSGAGGIDWSPAARMFPLAVTITTATPIDDAAQTSAKALVATAIGFDAGKGDSIDFRTGMVQIAAVAPLPSHAARPAGIREPAFSPGDETTPVVVSILLFLALAGLGVAGLWHLLRPKRLSEADRAELAAKFRELVGEGERDAA
jgi:flagellar M-ring protein FliF